MQTLLAAACFVLLLGGIGRADDLPCPPQEVQVSGERDFDMTRDWRAEYQGPLTHVMLHSFYNLNLKNLKSEIMCYRTLGAKSLKTNKRCRLIAGKGDVHNSADKHLETNFCTL